MTFSFTVSIWLILAVIGFFSGGFIKSLGARFASDPEGRGGYFVLLVPFGRLLSIVCVAGYLLWRIGQFFGWFA